MPSRNAGAVLWDIMLTVVTTAGIPKYRITPAATVTALNARDLIDENGFRTG